MGRGERVKSASPVTNMSSTLLGPVLPWYVAIPVQVICAARATAPRLIAKTWALFVVPVVEELRRVELDDTSPVGGHKSLLTMNQICRRGRCRSDDLSTVTVAKVPRRGPSSVRGRDYGKAIRRRLAAAA